MPFTWRGLDGDGFRVLEKTAKGDFVTFNVQIPLRNRALQVGFGGPATEEAFVKRRVAQVFSTLDGDVNW